MPDATEGKPPKSVSAVKAGLGCRCPRCGRGKLFAGYLTVADACAVCGLDLGAADAGDGPAVFVVLIVGMIVVAAALVSEVLLAPPLWLHLAVWIPVILGLSLWLLRPFTATLIALQFKHDAGEATHEQG